MAAAIRTYIKYDVALLRVLGLWTDEDSIFGTKYYWMYHIFVNVFCIGLFNLAQFLYVVTAIDDLEKLSTTGYLFVSCAVTNVKTYYYCKHFALLKSILSRLDQEDFQPRNDRQRKKVSEFMRIHVFCQIGLFICYILATPLWVFSPLLLSKERTLPFKAWYPFDETENSTLFVLCFIHQSIALVLIPLANTVLDLVTVGLIAYVGVECDILADLLEHLHEFTRKRLEEEGTVNINDSGVREKMNGSLLSCVRLHWKILRLARDTNKIFNIFVFVLFANSLLTICLTMLQMTVVGFRGKKMFILYVFLVGLFSELLMYCWFSTEVTVKSDGIGFALYKSDWINCPKEFRKNMAFFILRSSQRPIRMFGLNFFPLSLATFAYIVKASWSFFAMLNNVRRRNL